MAERSVLLALHSVGLCVGGQSLLTDVGLQVARGERVVILGANGAGKSTLLKVANGVLAPTTGRVHAPPRNRQAHVFQRPALLRRSVFDNVCFPLAVQGIAAEQRQARAASAIAACGLDTFAARQAYTLSGGEQQRLAIARAWACQPDLLFADEPTANLAPGAVRDIEALLLRLHECGATLVMTTHQVAQARRMASRIVFVDAGRIVEDRPAREFFVEPESAAARSYLQGESL